MKNLIAKAAQRSHVEGVAEHEDILMGWLSSPHPDYAGLSAHLQTVANMADRAASQADEYARRLKIRLEASRGRGAEEQAAQQTFDVVSAYVIAARQIAVEAALRNEYFGRLQPFRDDHGGRRTAGSYALLARNTLIEVFEYRNRAAELAGLAPDGSPMMRRSGPA